MTNNIIINAGDRAVSYDDRAREGALDGGWFDHAAKGGDMWTALYDSPRQSEIWQSAFPQYKTMTDDFAKADTADFIPNPANSTIRGNVILDVRTSIGYIAKPVSRFSSVEGNLILPLYRINTFFADAAGGDYRIRDLQQLHKSIPEFREIPLEQIGRTES